jgi:hypothetical protein
MIAAVMFPAAGGPGRPFSDICTAELMLLAAAVHVRVLRCVGPA